MSNGKVVQHFVLANKKSKKPLFNNFVLDKPTV